MEPIVSIKIKTETDTCRKTGKNISNSVISKRTYDSKNHIFS